MKVDVFSSAPARGPIALIDLVETRTSEASRAFICLATELAEAAGGRVMLANQAIAPMIVPDEGSPESDDAIGLVVVSHYPTRRAGQAALGKRQERDPEFSAKRVRTYAARLVGRIESLFGRTLPYTLGRLNHAPVPKSDDAQSRQALIGGALILGEQPDEARWTTLAKRAGQRPIWMVNFLEFRKTAAYEEDAASAAPATPISGARAYRHYGSGMISSLAAVGGRVGWSGYSLGQVEGTADGKWHQVAIAVYPSPAAMMTMLTLPKYRAAHVHRAAALARTRLLATRPMEGMREPPLVPEEER